VIDLKRNDELGYLAMAFNDMTARIREAQAVLVKQEKEDEQMRIAADIQRSLFPDAPISTPVYDVASFTKPARTIGGDYHFYRPLDGQKVCFLVADVSGKGVPAALVTFMIATMMRNALANAERYRYDTGAVLTEVNKIIASEMLKYERFATMMICFYDMPTRTLNFVSAGHGQLYIYRDTAGAFELIEDMQVPVGISDDSEYTSGNVTLGRNDAIVLFTDGVNEAYNVKKEEYGAERLKSVFLANRKASSVETCRIFAADIAEFSGTAEQHDDITMVVFRVRA
ncbi:MAG: SpoIIE family protein phosphatase, partial [Spirochaetota bacterium]